MMAIPSMTYAAILLLSALINDITAQEVDCFDNDTDYPGNDINLETAKTNLKSTAKECQALCDWTPECQYFTWSTNKRCYLKSIAVVASYEAGAISGPKRCKVPDAQALTIYDKEATNCVSEGGIFFGYGGGRLKSISDFFKVGENININMWIKPKKLSGLLLAVQGPKDYCILEMVNGQIVFRVDNGKGPIFSKWTPEEPSQFVDGEWHEIVARKYKHVVQVTVDNIGAGAGMGEVEDDYTDTNNPLYIGGHDTPDQLDNYPGNYEGCIRNININNYKMEVEKEMLHGNVQVK